jgi:pyrroline-5-carboxylate reductase
MSSQACLGFLGGGQMATALARGAIVAGVLKANQVVFCEPSAQQQARLAEQFPEARLVASPAELFREAHRIVLAIKPQVMREIGNQLQSHVTSQHLIVSIVAGITLPQLHSMLGTDRLIRVMPNTPCQVLAGASGIAAGRSASTDDLAWAEQLMNAVGTSVRVSDHAMHAVTAVSGSGPAYVLTMIEALADGGVAAGLSRDMALQLAAQTVYGTAKMMLETKTHPAVLRDQVVSPAGTTIAALRVLEQSAFRSALIEAVMAACNRSQELSGESPAKN